eukprot:TRINITY_DN67033_c5_g2_i1.p2 TRINITY_DN67033_c5_g2~~TRINITY_DN67033_c5_g2_i1.p2  ORF type:complete len:109 (-),score=4.35 TRINITY_DN67033_c5_g2_i1:376-702(-)
MPFSLFRTAGLGARTKWLYAGLATYPTAAMVMGYPIITPGNNPNTHGWYPGQESLGSPDTLLSARRTPMGYNGLLAPQTQRIRHDVARQLVNNKITALDQSKVTLSTL